MPATAPTVPLSNASAAPSAALDPGEPVSAALPSLYEYLAAVPDHRARRGCRHPLVAVLAQVVCALLCGASHLQGIADWGRDHSPELLSQLGFTRPVSPCCATLHYLLAGLNWSELEAQVRAWVAAVEAQLAARDPLDREPALAMDGKTLRGSLKMGAEVTQMVSALGHRLGLTAAVVEVQSGDEIAAVEELLERVVIQGRVITLDALHTQRKTAAKICARGGEYLMTVKGNQPELREAIVECFAPQHAADQDRESVREIEAAHGRIESRWLLAVSVPGDALGALADWPGARQAFVVRRSSYRTKQRQGSDELVYGVTSLTREEAGAADLLRLSRGHWRIETRSHWVRDVTMHEDASLVRTGRIAQTLALCRTVAISRLRLNGARNIAREIRRLAAKPDACLRLLGVVPDN